MIPPFEKRAKYHRNVPGGIYVNSREEEEALGPEWVNRPDLVEVPFQGSPNAVETKAVHPPEGGDQLSAGDQDPWTIKKKKAAK